MSERTTAPVLPAYQLPQRVTQLRVTRAELTKLRSLPSAGWSLLIAVAVTIGIGALADALRAARPPHGAAAVAAFDPTSVSLGGVEIAMLVTGALGVLFVTGEYASGQAASTFAAVPRRVPVLWGKATALAAATVAACAVATLAAFGIAQPILAPHHLSTSLGAPGVLAAVLGSALMLAVSALLGLGLGTLLRSTAGATGILFGLLFGLPLIASLLPAHVSDQLQKFMPLTAGMDITSTVPGTTTLAPWTGLGVFAAYAVVVLGLAAIRLPRQEV